jgi:hypothetical protein
LFEHLLPCQPLPCAEVELDEAIVGKDVEEDAAATPARCSGARRSGLVRIVGSVFGKAGEPLGVLRRPRWTIVAPPGRRSTWRRLPWHQESRTKVLHA